MLILAITIISFFIGLILKSRYVRKEYDSWLGVWMYMGFVTFFTPIFGIPLYKFMAGNIGEGPYSRIYGQEYYYHGRFIVPDSEEAQKTSGIKMFLQWLGIYLLIYFCLNLSVAIYAYFLGFIDQLDNYRKLIVITNLLLSIPITIFFLVSLNKKRKSQKKGDMINVDKSE